MNPGVVLLIFGIISLILTIASLIYVTPRRRAPYLSGFLLWLHGVFNFDSLLIDKILKFFYIFTTVFSVLGGFGLLFVRHMALYGLILMVGGPIAFRLMFESFMLFIILVRNTTEINKKLGGEPSAPAGAERPERQIRPVCPNCGATLKSGSSFCTSCGTRLQ